MRYPRICILFLCGAEHASLFHLLTDRPGQPCVYSSARSAFIALAIPLMTPLTKTLAAAIPVALLAACGSTPTPSGEASGAAPMVYVSSQRTPASIASCLDDHVSRVRTSRHGVTTQLAIGSSSSPSYIVTLTPSATGTVVRVTHDPSVSNDPPEDKMRFHIARCTI